MKAVGDLKDVIPDLIDTIAIGVGNFDDWGVGKKGLGDSLADIGDDHFLPIGWYEVALGKGDKPEFEAQ